jgi:hypothetical protein
MANQFVSALNAGPKRTTTTNGADSFTELGVENPLVALSFKLVRDLKEETLISMMNKVLSNADPSVITDLFVLAFQTRDVRGGKGERKLFYQMYLRLYEKFGVSTLSFLELVPYYGCYKDLREIWSLLGKSLEKTSVDYEPLKLAIVDLFARQLMADNSTEGGKSISLAGKWAPREKSKHGLLANALTVHMFPGIPIFSALKQYRKLLTGLNKRLQTIEQLMCNGKWSDICPSAVPARNLKIHRQAFMNVNKDGSRRSERDDRVECARLFQEFLDKSKTDPNAQRLRGEILHPHELVQEYLKAKKGGVILEDAVLESQWESLCANVRNPKPVAKAQTEPETTDQDKPNYEGDSSEDDLVDSSKTDKAASTSTSNTIDDQDKDKNGVPHSVLSKMCVMLDTSGSMSNGSKIPPILPAMGLTALITRINHPVFRNFYIRFSKEAEMMRYAAAEANPKLCDIITYMLKDGIVSNTNFQKAYQLILRICIEHKVPEADLPEYLLVLSDMQFDQAEREYSNYCGYSTTVSSSFSPHYLLIQKEFQAAGYSRAPKILFWNLNGNTKDFPATAHTEGVEMISGFSGALLKHFMQGNFQDAMKPTPTRTPYDTLRSQLDDERYDPVRKLLSTIMSNLQ